MTDPHIQDALREAAKTIENGMPTLQVTDIVFNAIKEKKFYILPNAEQYKPLIQA